MKITDKNRISEPLRQAVEKALNDYLGVGSGFGNTISVTSAIQPVKITVLTRQHDWELEADIVDVVEMFIGQMVHMYLKDTGLTDVRAYSATVTDIHGNVWTVSGTPDYLEQTPSGLLVQDFKVTKAWAIRGRVNEEWQKQQEIYRWILCRNGQDPERYRSELVALVKDWSKFKVSGKNYPQAPVGVVPLLMPDVEETEHWLAEKLGDLARALASVDALVGSVKELPDCTDSETWAGKRCARCFVRPWCAQGQRNVKGQADIEFE